jgi:hypothetical protein
MRTGGVKNLKMGPIGCSETSVRFYQYSLRKNPQKRSSRVKELHEEVVLQLVQKCPVFVNH